MEASFVEEVAASLVREFLSKKGLKKTSITMDKEFPRTALSINNRSELRNILHLQSLYKENKAKENPLPTILEIMTNCFLENTANTRNIKGGPVVPHQHKLSQLRYPESPAFKNSLFEEETSNQTQLEKSKLKTYSCEIDEELVRSAGVFTRHPSKKSEKNRARVVSDSSSLSRGEKKLISDPEDVDTPKPLLETRTAVAENWQTLPQGFITKGVMAASMPSPQEGSLRKRHLREPSGISSTVQQGKAENTKGDFVGPAEDHKEGLRNSSHSPDLLSSRYSTSLDIRKDHSSKSSDHLPKDHSCKTPNARDKAAKKSASGLDDLFSKLLSEKHQSEGRRSASSCDLETNKKSSCVDFYEGEKRDEREDRVKSAEKNGTWLSDYRKTSASASSRSSLSKGALELVDVEDEEILPEACKIPNTSTLHVLQVTSTPISFFLAKELKILLFGSSLGCFSEEWKIQSFTFNDNPQLKYGITQKKGGPCGVLAAVQACVLQHLIFDDRNRNSNSWCLQISDAHRTYCLALALASILWRAGSNRKATVALYTGLQQFTPAGKYKADGILESVMLHFATKYEDLLKFLRQNIHQFEGGPYGCILLTLSVILSRSIDQVRGDFDVSTNRLIGAHGYCTQELVNLLLTGNAVSNVFNDVMELDSGNGNVTILKGVPSRSDIGLLSLFEHYEVCQVGCYLKTPRFPIWVVCSESHFSVLFCLHKELLGDWKAERCFDLYYYDGLANQQEEIRLTVDTSQPYTEDRENDLVPPLELCIRTKWKGAVVNWNDTEPIL